MSVTNINAHPRWSVPTSAIECLRAIGGMNVDDLGKPQHFHLKRRTSAAEIWFTFSGAPKLAVNISVHRNVWPENFKAARQWMAENFPDVSERPA